jgi:hypothetical protein
MNNLEQIVAEQRRLNDNLNQLIKNLGGLQELGRQFAYGKGFGAEGFGNVTFPRFETFINPEVNIHYKVGFRVKKICITTNLISNILSSVVFTKNGFEMGTGVPSFYYYAEGEGEGLVVYEIDCDGFIIKSNFGFRNVTFYGF